MSMVSDEAAFAEFRRGERDKLELLVRRYEGPLFRFLARRAGSPARAEDLFQETWMAVIRGQHSYDASRPFKAWLYSIALNLARRARRDRPEPPLEMPPTSPESPDVSLARLEASARIRDVVNALPDAQREVFLLYESGDLTYAEIADVLDRPVGTVKSQMHYALLQLRSELERLGVRP